MSIPVYKHQKFIIEKKYDRTETKRFSLELTIDNDCKENLIVIMKNPSRANLEVSDKTVFNVCNYVHQNKNNREELKNIGKIIILNLIPIYETYANELQTRRSEIIDRRNLEIIKNYTSIDNRVIIAWGNPPEKLEIEYEILKESVLDMLVENKNRVFHVDKLSLTGNPKHAQVWGHKNELIRYEISTSK